MRRIGTIFVVGLLLVGFAFAGGIVTNTNQSADFIRMMNRNASTDIDAVYFNPAGLTSLNDGLHFYLSSQTIYQDRTVMSDLPSLHSDTFKGETFAPVFPNFYVAYKTGDLAIGAGFVPIGGGGSAVFDDGLPSFEGPMSLLPSLLTGFGLPTTDYDLKVAFDGSSTYLGGQAVVSYKVNDFVSVAGGVRYFQATNTYKGHLKDVMIDPTVILNGQTIANGNMVSAPTFFNTMAGALTQGAAQALGGSDAYAAGSTQAADGATQASGAAAGLQPFIDGGAGAFTFDQLLAAQMVDQATVDAIAAGVVALGGTFDSSVNTPTNTQAFLSGTADYLNNLSQVYADSSAYYLAYSQQLTGQAADMTQYAEDTGDKELDNKQTGSGLAPIFGLYLTPMEGFNIGIRYEGKATMKLKNETKINTTGLPQFDDGVEIGADMPAMLALGVSFKALPSLRLVSDVNYYFNKDVDWSGKEDYLVGGMELGAGFDFMLNEQILLSAGYLAGVNTGALKRYHTDLSHSIPSSTIGLGGKYFVNDNLYVVLGVSNTFYHDLYNSGVSYQGLGTGMETYDKNTIDFAIGIGYSR